MIDQRKRIFAVSLWLLDLVLTAASFLFAYQLRLFVYVMDVKDYLGQYTPLALREYLWLLAIILPIWAVLLPLFRVYSELTSSPAVQIIRLTKGVFFAWMTLVAAQ